MAFVDVHKQLDHVLADRQGAWRAATDDTRTALDLYLLLRDEINDSPTVVTRSSTIVSCSNPADTIDAVTVDAGHIVVHLPATVAAFVLADLHLEPTETAAAAWLDQVGSAPWVRAATR